jgi:hypothetical protein
MQSKSILFLKAEELMLILLSTELNNLKEMQRLADGGRVSMSDGGLTNTIPPAKGPDSQGVESLFRRRYN